MKHIGFIESSMRHRHIVFLITILLGILGLYALIVMPKQEFPTFTIRQGLVVGVYPGASSEEVEQQLTTTVEKYLFSYKEIKKKKTYSISKEGMMIVMVELNDNVTNADEFWSKLNHGLNNLKAQMPAGVLALISDNDFGDTSALLITLESDNKTYRELEDYLKELENRLRRIESVAKLRHFGLQKEQISIYLEKEKLTNYGISSSTILASLFAQGFTTVSGAIDNKQFIAPIHISKSYANEQDIAEQIIYSDPAGNIIRLKDVARIVREYPDPESYITNNGHKCLLISLEMEQGNNIVQYGKEVTEVLEQFQNELPKGVNIKRVADQTQVVSDSISTFLRELAFAIIGVILVTMILLPFRVAAVAATSIPITVFASLGIMYLCGIELNTVTLASLIVVLGMIVDNSIVIVDSYMEKLDHRKSRWHAAISSAKGFFKAIFSATLAISITFFPFLFTLKGIYKDFVQLFPWTISLALGISLLVAMVLIPFVQYRFITKGFNASKRIRSKGKHTFLEIIQETYEKWLFLAFKHPKLTIGGGVLSVLFGLILFIQLPQRLMPVAERNQFAVEIHLPQGNSLEQTSLVAGSLEKIMKKDDRILSVTTFIGTSSPRFHTAYAPNLPAKNYAQFIVNTPSNKITEELLDEYSEKYSEYFPNAYIRFKQLDYQLAYSPIELRISGNDMANLKITAESLMTKMRNIPYLRWIHTNYEEMLPGARVDINSVEANRLGITKTTVATNLAMRFSGLPLTTLWENDYPIGVKLKAERESEATYIDIENEYIHSLIPGVSVPLRQIATVNADWTQGQIVRRNGVRTVSVMCDVKRGMNINQAFREVRKMADAQILPSGINLQYGGIHETDVEALPQILGGLFLSIFIIFLILLFHFRKISLALLVLAASALSIFGAVLGILVMRLEFGVTAILGIVSLIGILVRNGIIMLDYAEELRHLHKKSVLEAAYEAGKRRMRPIFLTSAAASMGVVPMIISKSPLWAPMGTVIFFGTMTSMILLVFFLPVAYWVIFRNTERKKTKETIDELVFSTKVKPAILTLVILLGLSPLLQAQKNYTLDQCKELALKNNVQVKNKQLGVNTSEEIEKAAFTKYFPELKATVIGFKVNKPLIELDVPSGNLPVYDGKPENLVSATQYAFFPGMSLSLLEKGTIGMATAIQPIFAGGQITTGNKLAKLNTEVNRIQLGSTLNDVSIETERQYWRIIELMEKLKTLNNYLLMVDTLRKEVIDVYHAGIVIKNDLLKVELKQNELRINQVKLTNGITLAKMAFCQYLGIVFNDEIEFNAKFKELKFPQVLFCDHKQALLNRPEYQLLLKSTEAEKYLTKLKKGEYMPQVGIGAAAEYLDVMNGSGESSGMVFGTVNIPISGWWEASYKLKERHLKEEQNLNTVNDFMEKLLLQMQQARNKLDETYKQVILADHAVVQAEENQRVSHDNYKSGLINISDLIEAQALLQSSRDNLITYRCEYQLAVSEYLNSIGKYK